MLSTSVVGRTRPTARLLLSALLGASALAASPALAQETPSQSVTINLIKALVKKGVLSRPEADAMIAQAETEAQEAQATAQAARAAKASAENAVAATSPASAAPGTSVRYVPDFVRDQIKDEVKQEVMADAKKDGLVSPDALPDWVRGIKITGDFRFRDEGRYFDKNNAYDFVNVGAINSGAPYNADPSTNPSNPPIINSRQNRNYTRIRARLGIEADIDKRLTAYFRVATGTQPNPDSTMQTLGGYFADKSIWLDRAYVDYRPVDGAHVWLGRMANPFHLSELVWDDDVNPDGVAASYERDLGNGLSAYALGAAYVLDYGSDTAPDTATADFKTPASKSKYIFAGQIGANWQATDTVKASLNAAYYDYTHVAGDLSPSCSNEADYCLTDYSRPGYSQKGNTLFAIRDITTTDPTDTSDPQYYGLASKFRVLSISSDVDWSITDGLHLDVAGHYAKNLAYSEKAILARGFDPSSGLSQIANNNETCSVALVGGVCPAGDSVFKSGDTAWLARVTVGTGQIDERGDWELTASYRHIEPDALLDAFTDQDFHLGGTNAKGWTIGGKYGVMHHTSIGVRWMNTTEISGPPFRVNLLQVDLDTHF